MTRALALMFALISISAAAQPFRYNPYRPPIMSRQNGAALSANPQYAIDCGGSVSCSVDGGALRITASLTLPDGGSSSGFAEDPAACDTGTYVTDVSQTGVLTCEAATASVPDATNLVTGGVRLTGDLAGTATSPAVVDDSHSHSGSTIAGLDTGDIASGTLAQARGGTGAAALTCTSGERLTSNGTAYSCAAVVTQAVSTLKDEGTDVTQRSTVNFTGAGVSCVDNAGANRTDCTVAGGGGAAVEVDVDFGAGADTVTTVVTGQSWVTATSVILCAPTALATSSREEGAEDAVLEQLHAAIHTRVDGVGFTLLVAAPLTSTGVFKFHCHGV